MLLNSYLAYRNQHNYKKDFMLYTMKVSEELASHHSAGARVIIQKVQEETVQRPRKKIPKDDLIHAWVRFQPKKQKRCRICSRDLGKRKDTVYHCPGCPGEPALCSQEHFMAWHTGIPEAGPKAGPSGAALRDRQ